MDVMHEIAAVELQKGAPKWPKTPKNAQNPLYNNWRMLLINSYVLYMHLDHSLRTWCQMVDIKNPVLCCLCPSKASNKQLEIPPNAPNITSITVLMHNIKLLNVSFTAAAML
jgi:hypothetical protein